MDDMAMRRQARTGDLIAAYLTMDLRTQLADALAELDELKEIRDVQQSVIRSLTTRRSL